MNDSYFNLLSPEPIQIPGIGSVLSPKLQNIAVIGEEKYQLYQCLLAMDPAMLFSSEQLTAHLLDMLNFFVKEEVIQSDRPGEFLVRNEETIVGVITMENYSNLRIAICRSICLHVEKKENLSNVKNGKALEIMEKLEKGRNNKAKQTKADENLELANIISAVANKSPSLNMVNIWDLTVFQLWDCFYRISSNNMYDIQSMAVAAWGDKDNHFDAGAWYRKL